MDSHHVRSAGRDGGQPGDLEPLPGGFSAEAAPVRALRRVERAALGSSAATATAESPPTTAAPAMVAESVADSTARLLDAEPTAEIAAYATLTTLPIGGVESSNFGLRSDPFRRRSKRMKLHKGIDYKAKRGTTVAAAGAGTVTVAKRKGSYGRLVIIDHGDGVESRYAHLQRIVVKPGQIVAAGEIVGTVGSSGRSTGPHLHFEVREQDRAIDPLLALAHGSALRAGALVALSQTWAPWMQQAVVRAGVPAQVPTLHASASAAPTASHAEPTAPKTETALSAEDRSVQPAQSARLPSFQR